MKQKPSKKETDFRNWYADCVVFCANNFIGPDDYVWSWKRSKKWRSMYDAGMTCEDAVRSKFESN